jgi:hypothetical protein
VIFWYSLRIQGVSALVTKMCVGPVDRFTKWALDFHGNPPFDWLTFYSLTVHR